MDHTIVAFTVGIVFSVKIWKKTGKLVWTNLCGPDYLTFALKLVSLYLSFVVLIQVAVMKFLTAG